MAAWARRLEGSAHVAFGLALLPLACTATSGPTCGAGTAPAGPSCVLAPAPLTCGRGTIVRGGQCVPEESAVAAGGQPGTDASIPDTTPPVFAGVTTATPASDSSVRLSWDAASDDQTRSADIVYETYWSTTRGGEDFSTPALVSQGGATSAVVGGLENGPRKYFFVVRARDVAGNVDDNQREVAGRAGYDQGPPVFGGCDTAVAVNATDIRVTWNAATDAATPDGVITYSVWAAESAADALAHEGPPLAVVTEGTETTFEFLAPQHHYYFNCVAMDARGNTDANTVTKDLLFDFPPSLEAGCGAYPTPIDPTTMRFRWCEGTDDFTPASELVYVVRLTRDGVTSSTTSAPGATEITIPGLLPFATYTVNVQVRDAAGQLDGNVDEFPFTTPPSFSRNIQPILTARCAVGLCHDAATATGGLILAEGLSYGQLFYVYATESPGFGEPPLYRVRPYIIEQSYLYRKIDGALNNNVTGSLMPPPTDGGAALDEPSVSAIVQWILDGAPNN